MGNDVAADDIDVPDDDGPKGLVLTDRRIEGAVPASIWACGNRELRLHTREVTDKVAANDWVIVSHYKKEICALVAVEDLDFLESIAHCSDLESVIDALSHWRRLGANAPLVNALKSAALESKAALADSFAPRVAEFPRCEPSTHPDGSVRAVDFGGSIAVDAQLTLRGSAETGYSLNGFLERQDPNVSLVLELPNGEIVSEFDEDGAVLNLRRVAVSEPVALLDIRVRKA